MSVNRTKKQKIIDSSHRNWMGGISFDINNPITKLRIAASSCFFGEPMYYHDTKDKKPRKRPTSFTLRSISFNVLNHLRKELDAIDPVEWREYTPTQLMEKAIDGALDYDPVKTLEVASELRNVHHIRTTPQIILVKAALHDKVKGTNLIRSFAQDIIKRADEMSVQLAYYIHLNKSRKKLPNSLKRAWRDAFNRFDEYQLAKYRMEGREVKTVDVANLCYGINRSLSGTSYNDKKLGINHEETPITKLLHNNLTVGETTWEGVISTNGSTKETWEKVIDEIFVPIEHRSGDNVRVNNYMALLRNLRNIFAHDVSENHLRAVINGIKNSYAVKRSKQLPFRFYSAYNELKKTVDNPNILDAIEEALMISIDNLPKFNGKVMSLCDNSGSAQCTTTSSLGTMIVSTIANLTGILTGMVSDEGYVGIFGDRLETTSIRKRSSVFDTLDSLERDSRGIGRRTENGIWLFFDQAIREKEHWDHIFVYSDMQAGHGGLYGTNISDYNDYKWMDGHCIDVSKLINKYRSTVNPNVFVYLVQVAGYQDTLVPEYYNRTFILGGWSTAVLQFAHQMQNTFNQ